MIDLSLTDPAIHTYIIQEDGSYDYQPSITPTSIRQFQEKCDV